MNEFKVDLPQQMWVERAVGMSLELVCRINFSSQCAHHPKAMPIPSETEKTTSSSVQLVPAMWSAFFRAFSKFLILVFRTIFYFSFCLVASFFSSLFLPPSIQYLTLVQQRAQFGCAGTHVEHLKCRWWTALASNQNASICLWLSLVF